MTDDPWSHTNKEWQETLDLARGRGWPTPVVTSNHGVTILACPGGVCKIRIFSTGKGTERVARTARKKVRNCHHAVKTSEVDDITEQLDTADRFLQAAESQLRLDEATAHAEELLALADDPLSEAGEALERLAVEFDQAASREEEARADRDATLAQVADDGDPQAWIGVAKQRIRKAGRGLGEVPRSHPAYEDLDCRLDHSKRWMRELSEQVRRP